MQGAEYIGSVVLLPAIVIRICGLRDTANGDAAIKEELMQTLACHHGRGGDAIMQSKLHFFEDEKQHWQAVAKVTVW